MTVNATTIAGIAPYFSSKKNKEYANHRKFHLRRTQTTPQPHVPMSVSDAESRQNNLRYSADGSKWYEYVDFDRSRVCLTAKPEYKINNRIIRKFYETV